MLLGLVSLSQGIEMIRPGLHHLCTRLEIQGVIVGRTDGVALLVRQLQFDMLVRPALLVEDRGAGTPGRTFGVSGAL